MIKDKLIELIANLKLVNGYEIKIKYPIKKDSVVFFKIRGSINLFYITEIRSKMSVYIIKNDLDLALITKEGEDYEEFITNLTNDIRKYVNNSILGFLLYYI